MEKTDKVEEFFKKICENQTVYSFGDKYLYRMSKDTLNNIEENKIASMIWLIGRSYAASPERIKGIKKENDTPNIIFEELAKNIIKRILKFEKKQFDKEYKYTNDNSMEDIELLKNSVQMVIDINSCRFFNVSSDMNDQKAVYNMISFSSKFLHFCLPKSVFIIDQYSKIGTIRLFNSIHNKTKDIYVNRDNDIKIEDLRVFDKNEYSNILKELKKLKDICKIEEVKENEAIIEYINHVSGCYVIAKYCKEKELSGIKIDEENNMISMPRLVDSILLKVGEAK